MAKETYQVVVDDLDGSPDAATIRFGLDGREYEIDLGPRNEAAMRDAMEPFVAVATRVRGADARGGRGVGTVANREANRDRNQAIRAWALECGVQLAERGRIAGGVVDAFDAQDVDALYEAVGLEPEPEEPAKPGRRRRAAEVEFSSAD